MDYSNRTYNCPCCGWKSYPGALVGILPDGSYVCPKCGAELKRTLPYPLNKFSPKVDRLYLATPYTSTERTLMETRYEISLFATAVLIEFGFEVYSPIVYTHTIAHKYKIKPNDSDFWVELDEGYIKHWATGIVIVQLPGYIESTGVERERRLAEELNIQTIYLGMETLYDITRALPSRLD